MQKLIIKGKRELSGKISISGSKNATLPILAATILSKHVSLKNIPLVKDIFTMVELLNFIGLKTKVIKEKKIIKVINNEKNINTLAPYKLVKTMRAGVLVLVLCLNMEKQKFHYQRLCNRYRPVNLHLYALKKLGAKIKIKDGYIIAEAKKGLKGAIIKFPSISVGATENALLAASLAKGKTILKNCAIEPEIKDLIIFLRKIGSKIDLKGRTISISEIKFKSSEVFHEVIFDRIELGTYMIASALMAKKIKIEKIDPKIFKNEIKVLRKIGVNVVINKTSIIIKKNKKLNKIYISTKPYPGFPTDLQAQLMVLLTQVNGTSKITEDIFENRFMHVPELKRMGAQIEIKGKTAIIKGPTKLTGAEVMATDLRASVSLVLAGLVAEQRTIINRIYHLDRGYEFLESKLKKCKAEIRRV